MLSSNFIDSDTLFGGSNNELRAISRIKLQERELTNLDRFLRITFPIEGSLTLATIDLSLLAWSFYTGLITYKKESKALFIFLELIYCYDILQKFNVLKKETI